MKNTNGLQQALIDELRDLYSAENQIVKALPKLIKKVSSESLKEALQTHLEETEQQVSRLERIEQIVGSKLSGKMCHGMKGLLKEGEEHVKEKEKEKKGSHAVLDALVVGACQRVEHYEIAGYGTARTYAEALGMNDVSKLLQATLDEEGEADKKLSMVSEEDIIPACMSEDESGMEEEEEDEDEGRGRARRAAQHGSYAAKRAGNY